MPMVDRDPWHGRMRSTTTTPGVRSQSPDPASATPWPPSPTSFRRGSRRRNAIAAMSASRRDKSSAQSRGWNRAGPRNRVRHLRRRPRSPPGVKPQPVATKILPIWPSGLKRRSANRRARRAHPPIRHVQRRRPISQRAAIRCRLRRHAVRAPANNDRHRRRPISRTKTRPPSTTRSNKRWRICWGGLPRAEVR